MLWCVCLCGRLRTPETKGFTLPQVVIGPVQWLTSDLFCQVDMTFLCSVALLASGLDCHGQAETADTVQPGKGGDVFGLKYLSTLTQYL